MIKAEIIADSINEQGNRLTSYVLTFPRIVLAEFNTHRMISRNSASSRAIPFSKPQTRTGMLERVEDNPFVPIKWMKDHKGMQGNEYFDDVETKELIADWLSCRDLAVKQAKLMSEKGLTKQVVNRLLEPFLWHTVIATGTEWENFFALRAHDAAEIHIQDLAYKMLDKYNESTPKLLKKGEWHIPFGDKMDNEKLYRLIEADHGIYAPILSFTEETSKDIIDKYKVKIATARCARVSYMNFEGNDDYVADIKLHDNLSNLGHWSPLEHCAINSESNVFEGNFKGFTQYRKMFSGENKSEPRVNKNITA